MSLTGLHLTHPRGVRLLHGEKGENHVASPPASPVPRSLPHTQGQETFLLPARTLPTPPPPPGHAEDPLPPGPTLPCLRGQLCSSRSPPPTSAGQDAGRPPPVPSASMKVSSCPQERRARGQVLGGEEATGALLPKPTHAGVLGCQEAHRASGFLQPILPERVSPLLPLAAAHAGPLPEGPFQAPIHCHPPTSYYTSGLSSQATSTGKPSVMLPGGSSSAPHILSAPPW